MAILLNLVKASLLKKRHNNIIVHNLAILQLQLNINIYNINNIHI